MKKGGNGQGRLGALVLHQFAGLLSRLFRVFHLQFLAPVVAILLAVGVFAGVSTWVAGPSKGILAVGKAGYLPKVFQKTNKNGVQVNILWMQAAIVTVLAVMFVVLTSV